MGCRGRVCRVGDKTGANNSGVGRRTVVIDWMSVVVNGKAALKVALAPVISCAGGAGRHGQVV